MRRAVIGAGLALAGYTVADPDAHLEQMMSKSFMFVAPGDRAPITKLLVSAPEKSLSRLRGGALKLEETDDRMKAELEGFWNSKVITEGPQAPTLPTDVPKRRDMILVFGYLGYGVSATLLVSIIYRLFVKVDGRAPLTSTNLLDAAELQSSAAITYPLFCSNTGLRTARVVMSERAPSPAIPYKPVFSVGEPPNDEHSIHKHAGPRRVVDAFKKPTAAMENDFREQLREAGMVLGFDMEWKADRGPGQDNKVALVQLAIGDTVWLIRTCTVQLPEFVRSVLLDENVMKVAAAFDASDRQKLSSSFGIQVESPQKAGFLDISVLAKDCGFTGIGVKKLAQRYGYRIEKNHKMSVSNWAARVLSEQQIQYACDDAFFTLLIAASLLCEKKISLHQSNFFIRARKACEIAALKGVAAIRIEDRTEHNTAVASFLLEVWDMLFQYTESHGIVDIPLRDLGALQGHTVGRRAHGLGISLGKKFLTEQRQYFALKTREGELYVRARSILERTPPTEDELCLPWEVEPMDALQTWLAKWTCHHPSDDAGNNTKSLTEIQLQGKLLLLARVLETSAGVTAAENVRNLATLPQLPTATSEENIKVVGRYDLKKSTGGVSTGDVNTICSRKVPEKNLGDVNTTITGPAPQSISQVHPSHNLQYGGGAIWCLTCGSLTRKLRRSSRLREECVGSMPAGSQGRINRLRQGRAPSSWASWPDGRSAKHVIQVVSYRAYPGIDIRTHLASD